MTLSSDLCLAIKAWIDRGRHTNLNMLSDKCSMPYSTLYKISKGDIEKPQIDTVLSILKVVLNKDERVSFLRKHYPSVAADFSLDTHFLSKPGVKTEEDLPALEKEFEHRDSFLLGQHLLSHCGITHGKIQELFGDHGLKLLEHYVESGLCSQEVGVYRIRGTFVSTSLKGNLTQVRHSVDSFKGAGAEVRAAYVRTQSEGVTLEAAQKIKEILHATALQIDEIANQNQGPHLFLSNLMSQLLDPSSAIEEARLKSGESK
jgi:hypothetical protein